SMGGLVARQHIQSSLYENDVDQLIFLGTPHMGAPKAYLMWEAGENDLGRINRLTKIRLSLEAEIKGYGSLFDYIHLFPIDSVSQLLPTYSYINDEDSISSRVYPNNHPRNRFLEDLNNNLPVLLNSGVEILNVAGDDETDNTLIGFEVAEAASETPLWNHGKPLGFNLVNIILGSIPGFKRGAGDSTVPLDSASFIVASPTILKTDHSDLPTAAEGLVYAELTGQEASTLITGLDSLDARILYIQLLSPVDMVIVAPDGKRIGKNFQTGQDLNEIPGAFYSGYSTEDEYVTIPNPLNGEYKIETQGTDNGGEYTVVASYISDATSTESSFVGQTTPGLVTSVELEIDNEHPENIEIMPTDVTLPQILISSPVYKDYLRSEIVPITVTATDADSGLFSLEVVLDGATTTVNSVDLFFLKLGNHVLDATATDFQNNETGTSTEFRVVATVDSTISDINRAFTLGWITHTKSRDLLIKTLNKAVKLEERIDLIEEKLPGKPNVIKKLERIEKRIDKILAKLFILELKSQRGKTINEQAYQLLLEDIQWLIDN
ncbi:MAG: hypothetical protein WAW81_00855, partial [Minisyncoccia bacterium]